MKAGPTSAAHLFMSVGGLTSTSGIFAYVVPSPSLVAVSVAIAVSPLRNDGNRRKPSTLPRHTSKSTAFTAKLLGKWESGFSGGTSREVTRVSPTTLR